MQMLRSGFALGLASLAMAAPTPAPASSDAVTPPRAQEFGVAFSVGFDDNKKYLGVHLTSNSTDPDAELFLVGRDLTEFPYSTPAYVNGSGAYTTALVFDLTNQTNSPDAIYGAFAVELGEAYGASASVEAVKGEQSFKWAVNQTIDHERDAAPQQLFACNATINSEQVYILEFGVTNENLGPPDNCQFTEAIQIYNVPGGLSNPAGP